MTKWPSWLPHPWKPTEDSPDSGTNEWTWTGPSDEGPPMVLYGRWRYEAEQLLLERVEQFDEMLTDRYESIHRNRGDLFERLHYFQNAELLTNEELAIWRAALQIRSSILADNNHATAMADLAHHAQAVTDVTSRVKTRIDLFLTTRIRDGRTSS